MKEMQWNEKNILSLLQEASAVKSQFSTSAHSLPRFLAAQAIVYNVWAGFDSKLRFLQFFFPVDTVSWDIVIACHIFTVHCT